jgi:prepilin peptidase CpaA
MLAAGFAARYGLGAEWGWWGSFAAGPVMVLLLICTVTDLREHRIYNWATYSAFLWGILSAAMISGGAVADSATDPNAVGVWDAIGGAALCFLLMLFAYSLSGRRGAGDVKLAAALGAWLGVQMGLTNIMFTYAVAGVGVVSWLILLVGPVRVLKYLLQTAAALVVPKLVAMPKQDMLPEVRLAVPMAPFFLIGTILTVTRVFG